MQLNSIPVPETYNSKATISKGTSSGTNRIQQTHSEGASVGAGFHSRQPATHLIPLIKDSSKDLQNNSKFVDSSVNHFPDGAACMSAYAHGLKITVLSGRELLVFHPSFTWESGVRTVWPIRGMKCSFTFLG